MPTLKESIQKLKNKEKLKSIPKEWFEFLEEFAKSIIEDRISEEKINKIVNKTTEKILSEKITKDFKGEKGESGITPRKGRDYFDGKPGKDVDEGNVIKNILNKLPKPRDGKDIDENRVIREVITKIPKPEKGKDGSPDTPDKVIEKIHTSDKKIKRTKIEGLEEWMKNIKTAIRPKQVGGGNVVEYYDLTSQCNGILKSFVIPGAKRILGVFGTQFPISFRPLIDWTFSGTTLTLTGEVSAPETSQTLYVLFVK